MKYQVTVGGEHKATVSLALGPSGTFTGTIDSDEFGQGKIEAAPYLGGGIKGTASLDGQVAQFSAKIEGQTITGNLSAWFFSEDFTGFQTA